MRETRVRKGLKPGVCYPQRVEVEKNYQGDIAALHALGFDAAKFDNCGSMKNLTKYAELMQATGKNYTVENCHWGHCWDQDGDPDASVSPTIVPAETRSDALGDDGGDAWSVLLRSPQQRPTDACHCRD